jgi:hypothetical protein
VTRVETTEDRRVRIVALNPGKDLIVSRLPKALRTDEKSLL